MSLVYNTNISKTEYLVDLENNGKAKQTALLSMSSTAPSGTFQKGSQYFNSTDRKIYTAVEDNVWGTTGKDPNFGIIYQCNNEYYVWDGDNLITTDLEGYEKLVNKATNFNTVNNTKYPTTKAVADYVVKESIVRNFTDAGITKTTSSDVFSDRTNNTGLAEEILAKQFPTGTTLYGEVRNQGMPTGIGNAEIRVEILETKSNGAQVIEFTLFSVDIEPKEWSHIYFSARTEQQNPWVWIPKAVPIDDYTSDATTTVPSSKALSDGLKSVEPNLYDIKTLSQAVIDKGWTYLCNSTKQMLPKAKIPTAYDDIYNKYSKVDKELSSFQHISINKSDLYIRFFYDKTTSKYYYLDSSNGFKIYKYDNPQLVNEQLVYQAESGVWGNSIVAGENVIIVYCGNTTIDDVRKNRYAIFDKNFNFLRYVISDNPHRSTYDNYVCFYKKGIFFFGYSATAGDNHSISVMDYIYDNIDVSVAHYISTPFYQEWKNSDCFISGSCCYTDLIDDKYVYILTNSRLNRRRIYRFVIENNNFIIENIGNGPSSAQGNLLYFKNKFYLFTEYMSNGSVYESSDCSSFTYLRGVPFRAVKFSISMGDYCIICTDTTAYITYDMENFEVYENNIGISYNNILSFVNDPSYFYMLGKSNYNTNFLGSTLVPKAYTDNYTINGTTVSVQYYKFENWKICISDGGSNDTNLDTVYNGLGYENYWLLDLANEQLCLPRNSNLYTQMYVGDDYEDITVPSGNYIPFALKPLKITNISASNWVADNTYTDYGYKCDLSCSGVTANMFAQVIFAPTEADSGNYATVCQTGSRIVTIYSKVNDTITIPSIVVMGV